MVSRLERHEGEILSDIRTRAISQNIPRKVDGKRRDYAHGTTNWSEKDVSARFRNNSLEEVQLNSIKTQREDDTTES